MKHFLIRTFVLREVMSKLFIALFCISILSILSGKSLELITCERLSLLRREVNILTMVWAVLWVALLMLEIKGHNGLFGLWILGRLYNVGIIKKCLYFLAIHLKKIRFNSSLPINTLINNCKHITNKTYSREREREREKDKFNNKS